MGWNNFKIPVTLRSLIFGRFSTGVCMHCKWRVGIQYQVWFSFMYSQKWNCYFQNRIMMFCLPVPTLIYLWEIYIFPGSVHLFCYGKYVDQSWEYINRSQTHECGNWDWGRAIPRKGIHKCDFPCSVYIRTRK